MLLFGVALLPVIAMTPVSEASQAARPKGPAVAAPVVPPGGPLPLAADPGTASPLLNPAEALPAVDLPKPPGNPSKAARDAYAKAGKIDKGRTDDKQGVGSGGPVEAPPETSTQTTRTPADSAMTAAAATGCQFFGSFSVCPPLLDKYLQARTQGAVGNPVSAMRCGLVNQGCGQDFAPDVSIYDSQWTVPSLVRGAIRAEWTRRVGADGGTAQNGPYGYPEGDETVVNDRPRSQFRKVVNGYYVGPHFPGDGNTGSIYYNRYTGRTTPVTGAIRVKWMETGGGDNGWMGYPEEEATSVPVGLRLKQYFPGIGEWPSSFIYGTGGSHGAHIVTGAYLDRYYNLGSEESCLGYPSSDDRMVGSDTDPGRWHGQDFERGELRTNGDRNDIAEARCPGNPAGPRWRYLEHPVSVASLVTPTAQGVLEGARYAQPGVVGEDFVKEGEPVATAMGDLQRRFTEMYGAAASPLVIAVSLVPTTSATTALSSQDAASSLAGRTDTSAARADAFLKDLAAAPVAKPTKIDHAAQAEWHKRNDTGGSAQAARSGAGAPADAQMSASAYPTPGPNSQYSPLWAPDRTYGRVFTPLPLGQFEVSMSNVHYWTRSGTSDGPDNRVHDPDRVPDDWGIELDYSMFNASEEGRGLRPVCASTTSESNYFAARKRGPGRQVISWEISLLQGNNTNTAEDWGAYFDGNDALDSCGKLGFSIGIGYPKKVNDGVSPGADIRIHTLVIADKGRVMQSEQQVKYQAVSNDCTVSVWGINVGPTPNSDCMGLNLKRPLPASLEGVRDREVLKREDTFMGDKSYFNAPGTWAWYSGLGTYPEAPFG